MSTIRILADDREPAAIFSALRALAGVEVEIGRLKAGDFLVDDRLLIERKTLRDFALSVVDGRLFSQASRLVSAERPSALILEGRAGDLCAVGVRREALQGALVTLTLLFGLPVLRSMDAQETAHLLLYAADQMRASASGAFVRPGKRPKGKKRVQLRILQGLPGVGPSRAQALLDVFGSVQAVLDADAPTLENVAGIGAKTATAIRWAVTDSAGPYGIHPTADAVRIESTGFSTWTSQEPPAASPARNAP